MNLKIKRTTHILSFAALILACSTAAVKATEKGYNSISDTEDQEVIKITEEISKQYPICPEILQALIFYESSNRRTAVSQWGDVGYMQVNPKWQHERMEKLGISDLTDGYSNILVGTDLLMDLCKEYGEISYALMAYNKGSELVSGSENYINDYAQRILDLSEKLERKHRK